MATDLDVQIVPWSCACQSKLDSTVPSCAQAQPRYLKPQLPNLEPASQKFERSRAKRNSNHEREADETLRACKARYTTIAKMTVGSSLTECPQKLLSLTARGDHISSRSAAFGPQTGFAPFAQRKLIVIYMTRNVSVRLGRGRK